MYRSPLFNVSALALALASPTLTHAQTIEKRQVMSAGQSYLTMEPDPISGILVPVSRGFHDIDDYFMNDNGDILLSATLDRAPGFSERRDSIFYVHAEDDSGRPTRLWGEETGSPIDGLHNSPNGAADYALDEDSDSYAMRLNGGNGRLEGGKNLNSGSPTYDIIFDDDGAPGSVNVIIKNYSGGVVTYNANSATYQMDSSGNTHRLFGSGDTVNLSGGGTLTLDGGAFVWNDAGYSAILDNGVFYARSPQGVYSRLFGDGDSAGGVTIDLDTSDFNYDLDDKGNFVFSTNISDGSGLVPGGIFMAKAGDPNSLQSIALTGDTGPSGEAFTALDQYSRGKTRPLFIGDSGDLLFHATYNDATYSSELIQYKADTGTYESFLDDGDPLGSSGYTAVLKFDTLPIKDVNQLGQVVMLMEAMDADSNQVEVLVAYDPAVGFIVLEEDPEEFVGNRLFEEGHDGSFGGAGDFSRFGVENGFLNANGQVVYGIESGQAQFELYTVQLPTTGDTVIPEPATAMLLLAGGGLIALRRRMA